MDLGKFVRQLFNDTVGPAAAMPAPKPSADTQVLPTTAITQATPEKPAPQRLPRMNTQEMRRLLSQIDFEASPGSGSISPEEKPAPKQDAGRQYLGTPSQQRQVPRIRGFWEDEVQKMEEDLSSLEKQDDLGDLERELENQAPDTSIACKRLSDSEGPNTFNGQPEYGVQSRTEPTEYLSFQIAGSRKELKASAKALKEAQVLLGQEDNQLEYTEAKQQPNARPGSRGIDVTDLGTTHDPKDDLCGRSLLSQEELAGLDHPASSLVFASAGVFFGKASGKTAVPLVLDEQAMDRARRMLEPTPEKTAPVHSGPSFAKSTEGILGASAWTTAGSGGGFMTVKGNLQLSDEAMARAKKLFESPEKDKVVSRSEENSHPEDSRQPFGFGKASAFGSNSFTSNMMLTDEAMEKARRLFADDNLPDVSEGQSRSKLDKPKAFEKGPKEIAAAADRKEVRSKGGFSSSSNPSKSLKSTLGMPKRSGAFVAPKQIRPQMDPLNNKFLRFPLPKGAFRDPNPLAGLSRDNHLRLARPRTSAFTNKLQINFEKYKSMSLTIAKRFKNKAVCPSFQRMKLSKCPGWDFISVDELYQLCEPFLLGLGVKSSEELVRELTAELRLQADKFEQNEEYVAHHLHMLSRKYVLRLREASKNLSSNKGPLQIANSADSAVSAVLSEMLTDVYCRYKREEFLGSKSPLRLMREGAINQERRVCLMVKSIKEGDSGFILELTDGWYNVHYKLPATPELVATIRESVRTKPKLDTSNDELILRLVVLQKIRVGTKLEISNLGVPVVAPEKLDEYKVWEPVECKIHYNSMKKCLNQGTKLGLIYSFPKPTRLENVYLHGGPVPLLDVLIVAKKGIKVVGGSGSEYLTMSDHQISEEPPSVSFALVVIDTLHVTTDYSTRSVVYHELQLRYQSLPAYISFEVGQRIELSNYKIAKKLGTPLLINFRQQYERGFLLQEQRKNCIQPKELPRNFKKTLPLYKLLFESRIAQRLTLEELSMIHFLPQGTRSRNLFSVLSIGAHYITHGKQEALFHIYKTHFIQVKYHTYDDYKMAQAHRAAAQDSANVRDTNNETSCTNIPNLSALNAEKQAFWRRFVHNLSATERSRLNSDPDDRSRLIDPRALDDISGADNSYANLVPPAPKTPGPVQPRAQQEEQTAAEIHNVRVADPIVVFFDLNFTGGTHTIEISKKTKVYIHQCSFEPPGSFVLGSNFIAEFCESQSFEKYLLSQYQQGAQVAAKEIEGGLKALLVRMQRYQLA